MAKQTKSSKSGRNKKMCEVYRMQARREVNKKKRALRTLFNQPNNDSLAFRMVDMGVKGTHINQIREAGLKAIEMKEERRRARKA
jgi:hypothetical protein